MRGETLRITVVIAGIGVFVATAGACSILPAEYPQTFQVKYSYADGTPVAGLAVSVRWSEAEDKARRAWEERNAALNDDGKDPEPYLDIPPFRTALTDKNGIAKVVALPIGHFFIEPEYGMTRPLYIRTVTGEPAEWRGDVNEITWPETRPLSVQKLVVAFTKMTLGERIFARSSYGAETSHRWTLVDPIRRKVISTALFDPKTGFRIESAPKNVTLVLRLERKDVYMSRWELIGDVAVLVRPTAEIETLNLYLDFSAGSMCGPNLIPRHCDVGHIAPVQVGKVKGRLRKDDGSEVFPLIALHLVARETGKPVAMTRVFRGAFEFKNVPPGQYNLIARDITGVDYEVPVDLAENVPSDFGMEIMLPPYDVCRDPVVALYR